MNRSIDWNLLKYFLSVAEEGSLSGAARRLGVSQPTLGRHIQTLERRCGQRLFKRHQGGLALSEQGAQLVPLARQMHALATKADIFTASTATEGGVVRLTAPMWMTHYLLPKPLRAFRDAYPKIEIELVPTDSAENLTFRSADLAIRTFPSRQLDVVTQKVAMMEIVPIASGGYLNAHGRPQAAEELLQHQLIGFDQNDLIIRSMRHFGWEVSPQNFEIRCDNQIIYWALICAGHGIGFGAKTQAMLDPNLEILLPDIAIEPVPIWLASHERMLDLPHIRALWDFLKSALVQELQSKPAQGDECRGFRDSVT